MADLGPVDWPPEPLRTKRLVLRQTEARDRAAVIELNALPEVRAFLGGPQPRDELERVVPEVPGRHVGTFAVEVAGSTIGTVHLSRRDGERPGHVRPEGNEVELGYLLLPEAWGFGYAGEACAVALAWVDRVLPGEPVVLCTQTANERSMALAKRLGFVEVERFDEFDAEQWFGVRWTRGQTMDTARLARRFLATLEARDWDAWSALLAEDVVYEMPQTRERITGRTAYVEFNQTYPGEWHLTPKVVIGDADRAVAWFAFTLGDDAGDGQVFLEVGADGLVTKVTDFWPEPYEPPARVVPLERW